MTEPPPIFDAPAWVCVGSTKAGTTWLYSVLREHPELYLPPLKELRYFYEAATYPGERLGRLNPLGDWHTAHYRHFLRKRLAYWGLRPHRLFREPAQWRWDLRTLCSVHDDRWYTDMFRLAGDRLPGDISPDYLFRLDSARRLNELLPQVKILVMLRHPIDWVWSFTRMSFLGAAKGLHDPETSLREFVEERARVNRYFPALRRIREAVGHERMHLDFYDHIAGDPLGLLTRICEFLDVDPQPVLKPELTSRQINVGKRHEVPEYLEEVVREAFAEDLRRVDREFGPVPASWWERMERTAD